MSRECGTRVFWGRAPIERVDPEAGLPNMIGQPGVAGAMTTRAIRAVLWAGHRLTAHLTYAGRT